MRWIYGSPNEVKLPSGAWRARAIAELFELLAEPHLIQPTIIYEFPTAVSPLSKQKPDDPESGGAIRDLHRRL